MAKVMIAMSGGVDSSVTAYLLLQQGYECIGATMRLASDAVLAVDSQVCSESRDIVDARAICEQLGIEHYAWDCSAEFECQVVQHFVESYLAGYTPNPCIECNRTMKFGLLYDKARELGCDYLATGHYARILQGEHGAELHTGANSSKDQSYVLYQLTPEQLEHVLFPLGGMSKTEVRTLAAELGFVNADKQDSEDICFVPDGDYVGFLQRYADVQLEPGSLLDSSGAERGQHIGSVAYTVGQRKGLGIGGLKEPFYVCGKDTLTNTVYVGPEQELYSQQLRASNWSWAQEPIRGPFAAHVRTRYHQREQEAEICVDEQGNALVVFAEPQRAIAPGQAVVAYDGSRVIGGGVIQYEEDSACIPNKS